MNTMTREIEIPKKLATAYMLIGVPGSGKSTWAEPLLVRDGALLISSDAYIETMAQAMGTTYGAIFKATIGEATKWMDTQLNTAIQNMTQVIWDQTNLTMKTRRPKLNKLLDAGYEVVAVAFECPAPELARRRKERAEKTGKDIPPSVIESMTATYVRPTRLEGFHRVIIVTPEREYEAND
jgi:predicted kinase